MSISVALGCQIGASAISPAWAENHAAVPLSVIDWLSDSVTVPVATVGPDRSVSLDASPPQISVTPLDHKLPDQAGLQDPVKMGLPNDFWGVTSAATLARQLLAIDADALPPTLRRFYRDLLITSFDPPIDASSDQSLYLARIDALLEMGRLEEARALIDLSESHDAESFRRLFDIALLSGTETEGCKAMEAFPDISPTYPARIFCLARNGEWDVAALTLGTAEALGILTPEEDTLLLHFLDPELFEGEPLPSPSLRPSPLTFRLYEAIGEHMPTDPLPVAFAAADLRSTSGWRTRLKAAERLAAADAMPIEQLLSIYGERKSAASGGIWDRVDAIQDLMDALKSGKDVGISATLPEAWDAATSAGYQAGFAKYLAPNLSGRTLKGPALHLAFEIGLMAQDTELAREVAAATPADRFLLAVAENSPLSVPAQDMLGLAVRRGLSALAPPERLNLYVEDGRIGEAVFRALTLIGESRSGDPDALSDALSFFRALGLDDLARQTAVELLLLESAA